MPPTNPARRRALADAAIELLASAGAHGVTHRAVERTAGLPTGTASNYFRTRESLLVAAAERIAELHLDDMAGGLDPAGDLVAMLTGSLLTAATAARPRYLAIFELQLEAVRRPALADALAALGESAALVTAGHHRSLGLGTPPETVLTLIALYGGALHTLVTAPEGTVTEEAARRLAEAIVRGTQTG